MVAIITVVLIAVFALLGISLGAGLVILSEVGGYVFGGIVALFAFVFGYKFAINSGFKKYALVFGLILAAILFYFTYLVWYIAIILLIALYGLGKLLKVLDFAEILK